MKKRVKIENYEEQLECLICHKHFKHLGSHIWQAHKILTRDYKTKFELPYNMPLISRSIYEKKLKNFNDNREKYLENIIHNTEHRFVKGRSGYRRISQTERIKFIETINQVNKNNSLKMETCPVCNMKFTHLQSHLFNKHKLLLAK